MDDLFHCGSCKHWRPPPKEHYEFDEIPDPFGRCERVPHYPGHEPDSIKDEIAFVQDVSGYSANLYCLDTFGCLLYESRS